MKLSIKGKGFSARTALIGGGISLVALVAFSLYGIVYRVYFDMVVLLGIALGAVCLAAYALWEKPATAFCGLAGVASLSFAMGLFFLNSYPVWADWYGQFNMYGSQGGIGPVVVILVLFLAAILCGIFSCFTGREVDKK